MWCGCPGYPKSLIPISAHCQEPPVGQGQDKSVVRGFFNGFSSNTRSWLGSGTGNFTQISGFGWKFWNGALENAKFWGILPFQRRWQPRSNPSKRALDFPWIIQSANNSLGEFNPLFLFTDCPWASFSFLFETIKWGFLMNNFEDQTLHDTELLRSGWGDSVLLLRCGRDGVLPQKPKKKRGRRQVRASAFLVFRAWEMMENSEVAAAPL